MEQVQCKDCGVQDFIIKIGGLICEKCRVIVHYPESNEYKEAREDHIGEIEDVDKSGSK